MKQIPETEDTLVLRTDFSNDEEWERVCAAIQKPQGEDGFRAYVECVSDPAFSGASPLEIATQDTEHSFIYIVDAVTMTDPDHSLLVLDVFRQKGRAFRVVPASAWSVENNLSLGNMDFEEFAVAVDDDGVFRGFP